VDVFGTQCSLFYSFLFLAQQAELFIQAEQNTVCVCVSARVWYICPSVNQHGTVSAICARLAQIVAAARRDL